MKERPEEATRAVAAPSRKNYFVSIYYTYIHIFIIVLYYYYCVVITKKKQRCESVDVILIYYSTTAIAAVFVLYFHDVYLVDILCIRSTHLYSILERSECYECPLFLEEVAKE